MSDCPDGDIDFADIRRIRLHRGTRVHHTQTTKWGLSTGCGKFFTPKDLHGQSLPPDTPVTCKTCLAKPEPKEN